MVIDYQKKCSHTEQYEALMSKNTTQSHTKLDEFSATAIASNDILSSCLYVSGITILFAGVWAPVVFLAIAFVLFCYKKVYTEVVEALPLNGGAYNGLLNATDKNRAAIAGVMTVLSYVATSVISAKTASEYVHTIFHAIPVIPLTIGIIVFFALLTIAGVKDSAKVAKLIFIFHIFSLTLFVSLGFIMAINNGWDMFAINWQSTQALFTQRPAAELLLLGFAASLLGVSGFESSANFVEEQKPGVFRLTLRNMLIGVAIFNPLIAIVILNTLDMPTIKLATDFVLSESAYAVGGNAMRWIIVADAFLVLSGAVLASFVGATGLLYRMTLDHCLPSSILLPKLKKRNANAQRLIILFAVLCISILFVTKGNLLSLAGVYTISFLGVMTAFALGNLILRMNRKDLKRTYQAPVVVVLFAAFSTIMGIIGNILINPNNLVFFLAYFIPAVTIVIAMIYRDYILESIVNLVRPVPFLRKMVEPLFQYVIKNRIVLFAHHPEKLFDSLNYIKRNETSRRITVVFCSQDTRDTATLIEKFQQYIRFFKEAQIYPNFSIDFVVENELGFGSDAVKAYANRFKIGRNNVFIGSIHDQHEFNFDDLGGVRIIQ